MNFKTFENFEPRKVDERNKKIAEMQHIFSTLIDMRFDFKQFEILEIIPVKFRGIMASKLQNTFLEVVENSDIACSFSDEELEFFNKFEVHDDGSDRYVFVGDHNMLCKVNTQSMGVRYLLNTVEEFIIFKGDVDVAVLSEVLMYDIIK